MMTEFNEIKKIHRKLLKLKNSGDKYYDQRKVLNEALVKFLRLDFSVLTKLELMYLISIVSTYRPVEPFSFLVSCSMKFERHLPF